MCVEGGDAGLWGAASFAAGPAHLPGQNWTFWTAGSLAPFYCLGGVWNLYHFKGKVEFRVSFPIPSVTKQWQGIQ